MMHFTRRHVMVLFYVAVLAAWFMFGKYGVLDAPYVGF